MTQSDSLFPSFGHRALPERIRKMFLPLCEEVPLEDINAVKQSVADHLQEMKQKLATNEFLDLKTASRVAYVLAQLLDDYSEYDERQKALIIGATRYFIMDNDAEHDIQSFLGLDDDVTVLNYVLVSTGQKEKRITI